MQFGVHVFPTEHSIQPDELARAVEARGLESLWFSEHTHIPVHFLQTTERGAKLPERYWQTYDIFVAMALAAAATKNIKIASGVALVIEHDPILLAKETATLDLISGGRFIFGGEPAGSNPRWPTTAWPSARATGCSRNRSAPSGRSGRRTSPSSTGNS